MSRFPNDSGRLTAREWHEGLTLLAGAAAFVVYVALVEMALLTSIARLLAAWAIQYGVQFSDQHWMVLRGLLEAMFSAVCGALVGRLAWRHWRRLALIFAIGFLFLPGLVLAPTCAELPQRGKLDVWLQSVVIPVPFILLGGWCGSHPKKRRRDARRAAGLCAKCSYDLTGNVSGVCPECGTKCQNVETSKSQNAETG